MMKSPERITEEISSIAANLFEADHVAQFNSKFQSLCIEEPLIDYILQVSTDEGVELEIGFFTETTIADLTLSRGKVYFYVYPVSTIKSVAVSDAGSKWTLTILGEKKFDYNIVKPSGPAALLKYQESLQMQIGNNLLLG
ncbi:MAG: hypothetical protein JNM39_07050 [Bdellovibrionaceae bacterium]|nr:hypothetical protein [Pseudobdellovibrionaceae bacterium]